MAWGSFGKVMEDVFTKKGKEIGLKLWRNTVELPVRALEIGEDLGIVQPIMTKAVDNVLYKPLRTIVDQKGEMFNKNDIYTRKG